MSWLQDNFFSRFFVTVITWLYSLTGSWVLAVIIFTVVVRLLLLPLDIKQRRTTMKQGALAGKVQEIQRRYKNDPRMAQAKTNELYKREGVKLSAGCLPMLLQLPIIFAMFGAITILSNTETVKLVAGLANGSVSLPPSALWVHNIWRPDTGTAAVMPSAQEFATTLQQTAARLSPDVLAQAQTLLNNAELSQFALTASKLPSGSFFAGYVGNALASVPAGTVTAAITQNYTTVINPVLMHFAGRANGYFIFPILSGLSMYLSTRFQRKQSEKQGVTNQPGGTMMELIFPLLIVWWSASAGMCFALYWTMTNLIAMATGPIMTSIMKKEKQKTENNRKSVVHGRIES